MGEKSLPRSDSNHEPPGHCPLGYQAFFFKRKTVKRKNCIQKTNMFAMIATNFVREHLIRWKSVVQKKYQKNSITKDEED